MALTNDQRAALRADRLARDKREREQRATTFAEPTVREDYANVRYQLDELRERLERIRDVHKTVADAARIGTPLARTPSDAAWVFAVRLANAWHGDEVEDPYAPLPPDYL